MTEPTAYRLLAHEVTHRPGATCSSCGARTFTLIRLAGTPDPWECPACCSSWAPMPAAIRSADR